MLRRAWIRLTRRLFWKIFVAFWLAMTIAGAGLLMVENTRTIRLAQRWRGVTGDALAVYAAAAVQNYENPQAQSVAQFLDNMEKRTSIKAWLFDAKGQEVSNFASEERSRHPSWLRQRMAQLVVQARFSDTTQFADLGGLTMAGRSASSAEGKIFVLVGLLPDTRYDFWAAAPRVQILRVLALLVVCGTVSWLLAHHLTHPLEELRAATRRLAGGDLSARTTGLHCRRDELAGLATDFNEMAEHIDSLLHKERRLTLAQRRLLADVAHELRSPIARATVALELARDALDLEDPGDGMSSNEGHLRLLASLDRIEKENGRLTELIDRLLVVSRLESGVMEVEFVPVDMPSIVTSVVEDANFEVASRGRSVSLDSDLGPHCSGIIHGVASLMQSAVENVVRNALRHTADGTHVQVRLQHEPTHAGERWLQTGNAPNCFTSPAPPPGLVENWLLVSVTDHGPGVPMEELAEVFRPFYRARGTRDRHNSGAGLGLTITARAIELHGGQFRICNLEEGGLLMEFRLPYGPSTEEANV